MVDPWPLKKYVISKLLEKNVVNIYMVLIEEHFLFSFADVKVQSVVRPEKVDRYLGNDLSM